MIHQENMMTDIIAVALSTPIADVLRRHATQVIYDTIPFQSATPRVFTTVDELLFVAIKNHSLTYNMFRRYYSLT